MVNGEGYREGNFSVVHGTQVDLRPLTLSEETEYLNQFSQIVRSILYVPSIMQEQLYFRERIIKQQEGKTFFYGIFDKKTNTLCGAIEIRDPLEHRGQLYCWLNEVWWGKGYMQEAINLFSTFYFSKTQKKYITAHVDVTNQRSYWALKRAGFADLAKIEGPHGKQYELLLRNKNYVIS